MWVCLTCCIECLNATFVYVQSFTKWILNMMIPIALQAVSPTVSPSCQFPWTQRSTRTHISLIIWIFNDHQNVSYIIEFTRPPLSSGHVCGLWRMLTYFKRWLFRSWDAIVEWGLGYFRLPFRLGGPILQHSSHTIESWCMIIKQIPNYLQEMLLFSG